MPSYLFAYHGGKTPESEEEGKKAMAAWGAWFGGMGEAIEDPGNPVGQSHTVSSKGVEDSGGPNPVGGYSIINAASLDEALDHAKKCPIVDEGGSIEVAEVIDLEM